MSGLRTLPQALARAAQTQAGITFVAGGSETYRSYADLRHASLGVATALREAGFAAGDLAALVIGDAEQFLTALFGVSLAGMVPASLNPPPTTGDLTQYFEVTASVLRAAGARAVISSASLADGFRRVRTFCPELAAVFEPERLRAQPVELGDSLALDDIAFVQFTSGSTSAPKGIALTHRNLSANIDAVNGPAGLDTDGVDVAVSWLPLHHDMGLVGMTLGALYAGRPAILLTPQDFVKRPADWLRAISRHRATVSFAPNFAYDLCVRRVKDRDVQGLDLSSWRVAGCGSEPIRARTLASFAERFASIGFAATSFLPSYGLAEHVVAATFAPRGRAPRVERLAADELASGRRARPSADSVDVATIEVVSCGRAFPGHDIRVVDERGRPVPERVVGEINLAGASVMLGYYKDEALSARAIRDGWLWTGDLGYLAEGELFVCGRAKDIIIINGRKYHPQDLEWAVDGLQGVRRGRVVAFGAASPRGSDSVVLMAEPNGTVASSALIDSIRRRIGDLFGLHVDEVVLVPSGTILRTASGKLQRAATKARYQRGELLMVAS